MDRPPPPSIDYLIASGVLGAVVWCRGCSHHERVGFELMGLPGDTPFPSIVGLRRFRCQRCGGSSVTLQPAWSDTPASGAGRAIDP